VAQKIGALIPVRLSSERLPGKALMQIAERPVLYYLLDRVKACRYIKDAADIVVCTTEDAEDDRLAEAVNAYGASVFRGDKDDIIKRFHHAIAQFGFDAVVQVDGDDPLTATEYMDLTMERLLGDPELGIVWSEGLPLGVNCKSFTRTALERVYQQYQQGQNDTGFIYFFTKTGLVKTATVSPVGPEHVFDKARLTLDYQQDFDVFSAVFQGLDDDGRAAGLADVVAFLKAHPEIVRFNANLDEAYWQRTRDKARLSYVDAEGAVKAISV